MRSKGGTPSEFEENGDYEVLRGQVRDNVEHQNLKTSTSRKLTTPNIHDGDLWSGFSSVETIALKPR